ncbi:hypothetical protein [Bacillus sp. CH30_1T]|uniref:hypothetical protein n=1 Tax=Bacillus sp. CH30_1T TaxID=2604836 RepID=UPI00165EAE35|nr:hypothetical protein [Bacillus sp. CH30_1T]
MSGVSTFAHVKKIWALALPNVQWKIQRRTHFGTTGLFLVTISTNNKQTSKKFSPPGIEKDRT